MISYIAAAALIILGLPISILIAKGLMPRNRNPLPTAPSWPDTREENERQEALARHRQMEAARQPVSQQQSFAQQQQNFHDAWNQQYVYADNYYRGAQYNQQASEAARLQQQQMQAAAANRVAAQVTDAFQDSILYGVGTIRADVVPGIAPVDYEALLRSIMGPPKPKVKKYKRNLPDWW